MPFSVSPPLYLVGKKVHCWRCNTRMPVVALLAPRVAGSHGDVCVFSNTVEMPTEVLSFIQNRVPTFQLRSSHMAGAEYYGNTCPKCHVIFGDFYLHDEPGAPFFPVCEEEARALYVTEIPTAGVVEIEASPGVGIGELILKHAKRI